MPSVSILRRFIPVLATSGGMAHEPSRTPMPYQEESPAVTHSLCPPAAISVLKISGRDFMTTTDLSVDLRECVDVQDEDGLVLSSEPLTWVSAAQRR